MPHRSQESADPPGRKIRDEYLELAVIPVGIAVNVIAGSLVAVLKLPIYLDALGTLVIALLVGWKAAVFTGVASFCLASILISPAYLYFVFTQAAVAVAARALGQYTRAFQSVPLTIIAGIALGMIAGLFSAPVITFVFDGSTGTGRDLVTAFFSGAGRTTFQSVLLSGLLVEPVDKTIQLFISLTLFRALPHRVLNRFVHRVVIGTAR